MVELEVTCVTKPDRYSRHEHITHIGGLWTPTRRITVEKAIELIDARTHAFYTREKYTGKRADVRVVREAGKRPHLRTVADGYWSDNLLALTECPIV